MTRVSKKRKPQRHLRKSLLILVFVLALTIVALFLFKFPNKINSSGHLKKLGYSEETIKIIKEKKLTENILENKWYKENLEQGIKEEYFDLKYIQLYLQTDLNIEEKQIRLYDVLTTMGYNENNIIQLYQKLTFYEITPLLVYDYQSNLDSYIKDVQSNRDKNEEGSWNLDNNYVTYYENWESTANQGSNSMLVNKHYRLDDNFVPDDLIALPTLYSPSNLKVQSEPAKQFQKLCDELREQGMDLHAMSAYRSYDYQKNLYNKYVNQYSVKEADRISARPGFSEHQTGLTLDVATSKHIYTDFDEADEYEWMLANAHRFGFIIRFPQGKEKITGYSFEAWHYRYLGEALASKVYDSKLTFDEYYMLYLNVKKG